MARKKHVEDFSKDPKFPIGSAVVVLRPNLWSRCAGKVIKINPDHTHRIHITAKDQETYPNGFQADVRGNELEWDL